MKKTPILFFSGILLFSACKKDRQLNPATGKSTSVALARMAPADLSDKITVSERGHLIIPDSIAYSEYLNFLDSNSVTDIEAFHSSIGFTSQTNVAGQSDNYFAPSTANSEYIFSEAGMVQIGSMLYRGMNSEGYFLAMPVSSINDETYAAMASGTFLSESMCRLKVGGDYGDNLEAFVLGNVGYDDPTTPPTPPKICERKYTTLYYVGGVLVIDEQWYFMGVKYKHNVTFVYIP